MSLRPMEGCGNRRRLEVRTRGFRKPHTHGGDGKPGGLRGPGKQANILLATFLPAVRKLGEITRENDWIVVPIRETQKSVCASELVFHSIEPSAAVIVDL